MIKYNIILIEIFLAITMTGKSNNIWYPKGIFLFNVLDSLFENTDMIFSCSYTFHAVEYFMASFDLLHGEVTHYIT